MGEIVQASVSKPVPGDVGEMTRTERQAMTQAQRWVLGLTSLASFMISLDSLVVSTALSTIRLNLQASLATLEWTVNAYNLTFAALMLTGSALGDRFGRKRMFIAGLVVFTVASVACALSPNIGFLIAARAVQGSGAALVMPLALTQLSAAFPPQSRGRVLGIFSGVAGLAIFIGPFIGGAVTEGLAWRWIFWLNLPIGLLAILLVARRLEESRGPNNRLDLIGLLLVTASGLGIVWALVRGNTIGWGSAEVVGTLAAGIVLLAAFVSWELRARSPMLPMRFFGIRAFATANLANFCLFVSLYGTTFMLAQYLQTALGYGPLGAGLRLMPWTATLMVCAPIAGTLADRVGERTFMVAGLTLNAIGLGWLALIATDNLPYSHMLLPLICSGCGISMAMPAAQKSVVGAVKLQEIGQASGAVSMLRIFGGVFGIAILGAVFAGFGSYASPKAFTDGFVAAISAAAAVAFAGAIFGLGMPGRRTAPVGPPQAAAPQATRIAGS